MAQNAAISPMVISGAPAELLTRLRNARSPLASAEECNVYCAVAASDSRMRRAIFSRMLDIGDGGGPRSDARTLPAVPEPSPRISAPSSARFFAAEDRRGGESYNLRRSSSITRPPGPDPATDPGGNRCSSANRLARGVRVPLGADLSGCAGL